MNSRHKRQAHLRILWAILFALTMGFMQPNLAQAAKKLTLGSSTSLENSGLLRALLARFTQKTGIAVNAVVQGSGAVLAMGSRGDLEVLITHHPQGEAQFKAKGFSNWQKAFMYNTFVLAGPKLDPANIKNSKNVTEALSKIAHTKAHFVSRGDKSGTHQKERLLWKALPVQPQFHPSWYKETGQGMGATLNVAVGLNAYLLVDNATWAAFPRKGNLRVLYTKDTHFHNVYTLSLVNPKVFPHVQYPLAQTFAQWLTSAEGHDAIANFKINKKSVFTPIR